MSIESPNLLPASGLVASLSDEDRAALSSYGNFFFAKTGSVVIEQGKPHGKLFFITSGLLHARRSDDGNDVLLGRIQRGEWIGEVDLFDPSSAVCSVVAIEPSQYWVITRNDLEEFINNYPTAGIMLLIGLASTLSRRIRDVTRKLAEQSELGHLRQSLFQQSELPPGQEA
jgi:CRP-like cAMP-binding protein